MLRWPQRDLGSACAVEATPNIMLRQLSPSDRSKLEPHLLPEFVQPGTTLLETSETGDHVYFPQGPTISLEQGNRVEVAVVSSEGMVGWPALTGCTCSPYRAVVRGREGIILKVSTEALIRIAQSSPALHLIINRFVTVINVQMGETIAAATRRRVEMRLARWILLRHDRARGDQLLVHHDEIADNLGTRRASVTDCLHIIEGDGLVRCRRGRISIRDRRGLEDLAGSCYGAAETHYRALIGRFGKPAHRPSVSAGGGQTS